MIITIYHDPEHAWGKVNKALLVKLGIADKISDKSFMREGKVYLEEDVDLSILIQTLLEKKIGFNFDNRYGTKVSRIRGYERYKYDSRTA